MPETRDIGAPAHSWIHCAVHQALYFQMQTLTHTFVATWPYLKWDRFEWDTVRRGSGRKLGSKQFLCGTRSTVELGVYMWTYVYEGNFIFNFLCFLPVCKQACQLWNISATGMLHNFIWYVLSLHKYSCFEIIYVFCNHLSGWHMHFVNKVAARPAHWVENLPKSTKKTRTSSMIIIPFRILLMSKSVSHTNILCLS